MTRPWDKPPTLVDRVWANRTLEEVEGYISGIEMAGRDVSDEEVRLLERRLEDFAVTAPSETRRVLGYLRAVVGRSRASLSPLRGIADEGGGHVG